MVLNADDESADDRVRSGTLTQCALVILDPYTARPDWETIAMRVFDAATVRARLPMRDCIDAMVTAMSSVTDRTITMPPRTFMHVDGSGHLVLMPGSFIKQHVFGAKVVSVCPENLTSGRPVVQGFVALFEQETGAPVALADGAAITALRTGAASGLATRLLATRSARTLGLLGCSVQAAAHLEAISIVRDIQEVRVWGRSLEKAREFVVKHGHLTSAPIIAVGTAQEAAGCDVVCVVTGAKEPVIKGEWLAPGCHINLVGAHSQNTREADTALIARARVYVDSMDSAFSEAGDILIPITEGVIDQSHIVGEIGALIGGLISGRRNDQEITVYKSLGVVAQDLIAANAVLHSTVRRDGTTAD